MTTHNAHGEDNLRVDQRLLAELKRLGIVQPQYDLSRLCGRNPSYFSSMMAKGYGLKLGSLMLLASRLQRRSNEVMDARVGLVLHQADRLVRQAIEEKCRLREIELIDKATEKRRTRQARRGVRRQHHEDEGHHRITGEATAGHQQDRREPQRPRA